MARIEFVEHRLLMWGEWVARGGGPMGGTLAMFNGEPSYWATAYNIPLNDEECWKTDAAVKRLPDPLRTTVRYTYVGNSEWAKKQLSISASVLSQRLDRAHRLLWAEWEPQTLSDNSLPRGF